MTSKILSLINLPDDTIYELQSAFELKVLEDGSPIDETLQEIGETIQAIVTNGTTGLTAKQMDLLPKLEIICAFGAGYEGIDRDAAQARDIVVTHAPGANAATVADHAIGFMLSLTRCYGALTSELRNGNWNTSRKARPTLNGGAIGIIGMGRVGRLVARRAAGFDMTVQYTDLVEHSDAEGVFYSDVVELAEASNFLVVTCPGGKETYHLVDQSVLRALGSSGYLVNVSRGSVVNTDDLIQTIEADKVAGVGLDVLETEPEIPTALLESPRVLLTPHMAGRSPVSQLAQQEMLLDNLNKHFLGS